MGAALISDSVALSQTPPQLNSPQTREVPVKLQSYAGTNLHCRGNAMGFEKLT